MNFTSSTADFDLDKLLDESAPPPYVTAYAEAEAARIARAAFRAQRPTRRVVVVASVVTALALGGTAAVAAPYLSAMPGYTKVASISYGVAETEPGISCLAVIAYKTTPSDPKFDAAIVDRFDAFLRTQSWVVPVPAIAREPYAGPASDVYKGPGAQALNLAFSTVVAAAQSKFAAEDPEERKFSSSDANDPLSHSLVLEISSVCAGRG